MTGKQKRMEQIRKFDDHKISTFTANLGLNNMF
jgi:hypothetical protein